MFRPCNALPLRPIAADEQWLAVEQPCRGRPQAVQALGHAGSFAALRTPGAFQLIHRHDDRLRLPGGQVENGRIAVDAAIRRAVAPRWVIISKVRRGLQGNARLTEERELPGVHRGRGTRSGCWIGSMRGSGQGAPEYPMPLSAGSVTSMIRMMAAFSHPDYSAAPSLCLFPGRLVLPCHWGRPSQHGAGSHSPVGEAWD